MFDVEDDQVLQMATYPVFAKLTCFKQIQGLGFPSPAVLKIVKTTEMVFKQRVLNEGKGISYKQKLDLQIQSTVLELLGPQIFKDISGHYLEHSTGVESDHLSSLLRFTVQKYLGFQLKTYGKNSLKW